MIDSSLSRRKYFSYTPSLSFVIIRKTFKHYVRMHLARCAVMTLADNNSASMLEPVQPYILFQLP
jgi:hypothetical protein